MNWEYKMMNFAGPLNQYTILTEKLNMIGQEGWELVSSDLTQNCFIFKRKCLNTKMELSEKDKESIRGYFGGKVG